MQTEYNNETKQDIIKAYTRNLEEALKASDTEWIGYTARDADVRLQNEILQRYPAFIQECTELLINLQNDVIRQEMRRRGI